MDRPRINMGCAAPSGMGSLLLLLALFVGGCLPDIGPTPIPIPTPDPVIPVPSGSLRVLIVEETSDRHRLLPDQVDIFTSADFRKAIKSMSGELRIWDQMIDVENESDAAFKLMLQQPRDSLPWIVIRGSKTGYSGKLPNSLDETIKLIEKHK